VRHWRQRDCARDLSLSPLLRLVWAACLSFSAACAAEGAVAACTAAAVFVGIAFACLRSAALSEWAAVRESFEESFEQQRGLAQQLLEARVLSQQLAQRVEVLRPAPRPARRGPPRRSKVQRASSRAPRRAPLTAAGVQEMAAGHGAAQSPRVHASRAAARGTPARGASASGGGPSVPGTPGAMTLKSWGREGFVFDSPAGGPRLCLKLLPSGA
jgi:hypothetical protein